MVIVDVRAASCSPLAVMLAAGGLGALGIRCVTTGACGTAAVDFGWDGIFAVAFGGSGITALGGGAILGSAVFAAALGAAGIFGTVVAGAAGGGTAAVAVFKPPVTTGFGIVRAFGTAATAGGVGATGFGTATRGLGGGAAGRLVAMLLGMVSCERGSVLGSAKSWPGARAAVPGVRLVEPLRSRLGSVGAGPNLSSTLRSTMTLGCPTNRLLIVDWATVAPTNEVSNKIPAPSARDVFSVAKFNHRIGSRLLVAVIESGPAIGRLMSLGDTWRSTKIT